MPNHTVSSIPRTQIVEEEKQQAALLLSCVCCDVNARPCTPTLREESEDKYTDINKKDTDLVGEMPRSKAGFLRCSSSIGLQKTA